VLVTDLVTVPVVLLPWLLVMVVTTQPVVTAVPYLFLLVMVFPVLVATTTQVVT